MTQNSKEVQMAEIELRLQKQYGPIVGGAELYKLLGFRTSAAFRQALFRGKLPVAVFPIQNRKGKFAHIHDIAAWLVGLNQDQSKK